MSKLSGNFIKSRPLLTSDFEIVSLGFGGSYELVPFPEERKAIDIGDYYSDFSLISDELGWSPKISLDDGLSQTIEYYKLHSLHYRD